MKQPDVLKKISDSSSGRTHSEKTKLKTSKSLHKRYNTTPINRKLSINLRSRLNKAVKGNYKSGSAVRDLGCTVEEFKQYLESLWQLGMSWDNYGRYGWHIDHIIPLCLFDLEDTIQLKKACHYSNLQPLWAKDNSEKRKTDGTFR